MYHSITFGEKNTWDDWHLIPASRPVFNPPKVKTNYVEIPGGDGVLDLTETLSGRPVYKNRTGSFEFYVENGFKNWVTLYSEIMTYLHGRSMHAILEDDPSYYYDGRFSVNEWRSEAARSVIVIDYNVQPYKRHAKINDDEWLWDTFNFETGVIRVYKDIIVSGTLTIRVVGDGMPMYPTIIASSSGMTVAYGGTTYSLAAGRNPMRDMILQNGINSLVFTGDGTITIEYRGGSL